MHNSDSSCVFEVNKLSLEFPVYKGSVKALNGVNLRVNPGEIVGLVGESGSGKSVTAMLGLRLLAPDSYVVTNGSVKLSGHNMLTLDESKVQSVRGRNAAMIFQEPMTALNPTQKVGKQLINVIRRHQEISAQQAKELAIELLRDMYIASPEQIMNTYPFELSGGMRQRVMIALAFSCNPELLIADEPTTALDVTVQRQVLMLLREKAHERNTAILFITHDMAVVSQICDRVYVMYAGSVVEHGRTSALMARPAHPYTFALLKGLPENASPKTVLPSIAGQPPDLSDLPTGCAFAARCPIASEQCVNVPQLSSWVLEPSRQVACWHANDLFPPRHAAGATVEP